jgi:hypothetical protein
MLPLLSKISDSQGGGSILLPFLDCIFSQIFMRGGIFYQYGGSFLLLSSCAKVVNAF